MHDYQWDFLSYSYCRDFQFYADEESTTKTPSYGWNSGCENDSVAERRRTENNGVSRGGGGEVVVSTRPNGLEFEPAQCHLCGRKFKNVPALNGHMRLHGGLLKKQNERKKLKKRECLLSKARTVDEASKNSTCALNGDAIDVDALIENLVKEIFSSDRTTELNFYQNSNTGSEYSNYNEKLQRLDSLVGCDSSVTQSDWIMRSLDSSERQGSSTCPARSTVLLDDGQSGLCAPFQPQIRSAAVGERPFSSSVFYQPVSVDINRNNYSNWLDAAAFNCPTVCAPPPTPVSVSDMNTNSFGAGNECSVSDGSDHFYRAVVENRDGGGGDGGPTMRPVRDGSRADENAMAAANEGFGGVERLLHFDVDVVADRNVKCDRNLVAAKEDLDIFRTECWADDHENLRTCERTPENSYGEKVAAVSFMMSGNGQSNSDDAYEKLAPNLKLRVYRHSSDALYFTPRSQPDPAKERTELYWQTANSDYLKCKFYNGSDRANARINVGAQFQAVIEPVVENVHFSAIGSKEDLIWRPVTEYGVADHELLKYLEFVCGSVLPKNDYFKEYALRTLHLCRGNIQIAIVKLTQSRNILDTNSLISNYFYDDCWRVDEIVKFQACILKYEKHFSLVAQNIKSKTIKQCVQFYYLWKKIYPREYQNCRQSWNKLQNYSHVFVPYRSTSDLDRIVNRNYTKLYTCEISECMASFNSKAALNGHIRVHGGLADRSRTSKDNSVDYKILEKFPCKLCGKVFDKIKSRSAHMKSHRPPSEAENKKIMKDNVYKFQLFS